ncbi:Pantetheinase [Halotydeus destructor]|nr:Pantetheinase [Halotydeus destructor]
MTRRKVLTVRRIVAEFNHTTQRDIRAKLLTRLSRFAMTSILRSLLLIFVFASVTSCYSHCFRGAVYEHARQSSKDVNLEAYEEAVQAASQEKADIIVLPEDGLVAPKVRIMAGYYAEHIPNVTHVFKETGEYPNPCRDAMYSDRPVLRRLSCAAMTGNIYVVGQYIDVQPCDSLTHLRCPADGRHIYNTQIAFDRNGSLIAKYHKKNLFGELPYDVPENEYVTFDTPFGRMGMMICFDILWKEPVISLIEKHNVTTLLSSSIWYDYPPVLIAHQVQQGFAIGNNVNLLAANIKYMSKGTTGSGIYSGRRGAVAYEYTTSPAASKLIVATLPVRSTDIYDCDPDLSAISLNSTKDRTSYEANNWIKLSMYKYKPLTKAQDILVMCHNQMCCSLEYKTKDGLKSDNYYMIMANSSNPSPWDFGEEMCALVAYDDKFSRSESTTFDAITLVGNFSTRYVYPGVMTNDNQLVDKNDWFADFVDSKNLEPNVYVLDARTNEPVIYAGIYGRSYQRDAMFALRVVVIIFGALMLLFAFALTKIVYDAIRYCFYKKKNEYEPLK